MIRKISLTLIFMLTILFLASCISTGAHTEEKNSSYKKIYTYYVTTLESSHKKVTYEYNKESKGQSIEKKAALYKEKIDVLLEIQKNGTEKMLSLTNDPSDKTYLKWSNDLFDKYKEYASVLTDAYMNSLVE